MNLSFWTNCTRILWMISCRLRRASFDFSFCLLALSSLKRVLDAPVSLLRDPACNSSRIVPADHKLLHYSRNLHEVILSHLLNEW